MTKHITISIVVYTVLFVFASLFTPDDKITVKLNIHEIDEDGTVTFKLINQGSKDVEFSSYTDLPGEPEVYFGSQWGLYEDLGCCFAPPSQVLKKGKGIYFKVRSTHERRIFPWRYRVYVSARKNTPEWMMKGMDWVYGRHMPREEYCELVSSSIYKGEVWE